MKKLIVSLICFCLILTLSPICYSRGTYPLGILTREQIIEKYFFGRTLDPIEGVWEGRPGDYFFIVKIGALEIQKEEYVGFDYLMIEPDSQKSDAKIFRVKKTTSPFIFEATRATYYRLFSPIAMIKDNNGYELFYSRSYPQVELK